MHKLFISGFPLEISELDLAKLVAPYGNINTIKIVRDRKTRICKGYAFIEMHTMDDAINVMQMLNNAEMDGRNLTVNIVEEKPAAPPVRRPAFVPRDTQARYTPNNADAAPFRAKRPRKAM